MQICWSAFREVKKALYHTASTASAVAIATHLSQLIRTKTEHPSPHPPCHRRTRCTHKHDARKKATQCSKDNIIREVRVTERGRRTSVRVKHRAGWFVPDGSNERGENKNKEEEEVSNGWCWHLREAGNRRLYHPEHGKISRCVCLSRSTGCAECKKNISVEASELSNLWTRRQTKQSRSCYGSNSTHKLFMTLHIYMWWCGGLLTLWDFNFCLWLKP